MIHRHTSLAAAALAGVLLGAGASRLAPGWQPVLPAFGYALVVVALALGVPLLLGSVGTGGAAQAMLRLWRALVVLAVLLLAAGATEAAWALAGPGGGRLALLSLAAGAGLLAGLGLVKLALRRAAAARRGAPH